MRSVRTRVGPVACLVTCLLALGCGSSPVVVDEAALQRHIAYLADDALEGREAGTAGCVKAERYIAAVLEAARLDAVEEQSFEFISGAVLGEPNALTIGGVPLAGDTFRPLAFSSPTKGSWPAVFVGYGIEAAKLGHDDYSGVEVDGKAVVVLAGSPDGDNPHGTFGNHAGIRAKALTATQNGARALVVVIAAKEPTLPEFRGQNISRDVGIPVLAVTAAAAGPRLGIDLVAAITDLDAHRRLSRNLWLTIDLEVSVHLERRTTRNILGWLRARHPDARDEVVIIGAHHDHLGRGVVGAMRHERIGEIHNGADDNASGVAALLEIARALAPHAASLRRHLLFMTFGAEEWGLLGSKHFEGHPLLRLPVNPAARSRSPDVETPVKPVAMINMDMIGRMKGSRLIASGVATSKTWPEILETVRSTRHDDLEISADNDKDILGSSDHISFYKLGVPVVFFFTGSHSQYHTPDDDLYRTREDGVRERLINIPGLARVASFIADVSIEIASRDDPPTYETGVTLTPKMSFRVVLRLLPDYGADVNGMRVAGVTSGGPADTAGIREGDVIVRFGETPVRSVRDYMVGLQRATAGKTVAVEIVREGQKTIVEVEPAGW